MGALGTIMFLKDKEPASLIVQVVVQYREFYSQLKGQ
jgi:hypothetical protein